jgi:methyl-accepting chemotaxis protein
MHPTEFSKRFKNWVNLSIHRRLVIWSIGFWVISISVLSLTVLWVGQTRMLNETARRNTQLAAIISQDINSQVNETYSNAQTFTQHLAGLGSDLTDQAEAVLSLRLASPQLYHAIYYFDDQGNQLFQLAETPENLITLKSPADVIAQASITPDEAVLDAFRRVGDGTFMSDVTFSGSERTPVLYIGLPVVFTTNEKRVIIYEVNLDNIWQSVDLVTIGQTGIAYVVSRNGIIIAHPDREFVERQIPTPLEAVLSGYEGSAEYVEPYSNRPVLGAYSPVGGQLGWGVIVQQDIAEAHASANTTAYMSLGIWFILAVAGTVGILLMVKKFTGPIVQLTGTARKIAETGDLTAVALVKSPD